MSMDLESLNFYISALSTHRKAGKPDKAFIEKMNSLYLLDQVSKDVYEMVVEIAGGVDGKSKKAHQTSQTPSYTTSSSDGGCGSSNTRTNDRGCGDPPPSKPATGSCGNHQSSNGRC